MEVKVPSYKLAPTDVELPKIGEQSEIAYFRLFQSSSRRSWYVTGCESLDGDNDITFEGIDSDGKDFVLKLSEFSNMTNTGMPVLATVARDIHDFSPMPVSELHTIEPQF